MYMQHVFIISNHSLIPQIMPVSIVNENSFLVIPWETFSGPFIINYVYTETNQHNTH